MITFRKAFSAFIFAIGFSFVTLTPAYSHAELVSSNPLQNSRDNASISVVTLTFNEAVKTTSEQFKIVNQDGNEIPFTFKVENPRESKVTLNLDKPLPTGSYLLTYKVVSEDGHLVSGSISFGTNGSLLLKGESSTKYLLGVLEYLSWFLVILAVVTTILPRYRVRFISVIFSFLSSFAYFVFSVRDTGVSTLTAISSVGSVASSLSVLLASITLLFLLRRRSLTYRNPFIVGTFFLFVAQGLFSGHHLTVVGVGKGLALLSHLIHLAAGALWLGALLYLLFSYNLDTLKTVSRVATFSVYTLVPSSLILTLSLFDFTFSSIWNKALLVKILLVSIVLLIGFYHNRLVSKKKEIKKGSLIVEIVFFFFIFAFASVLGSSTPSKLQESYSRDASYTSNKNALSVNERVLLDDSSYLTLEIDGVLGEDSSVMVTSYNPDGSRRELESLSLSFSESDGSQSEVELNGSGSHFMGKHFFSVAGKYQGFVVAVVDGFTVVNGVINLEIKG